MTVRQSRAIKSAERVLALFELFSREQQPFTVGHIAAALAIPQPSATVLLRKLTELGYLQYHRNARTFSPSIRVALLGSWIGRRFSETEAIGSQLDRLQRKTGETAFLAMQNGAAVQYVLTQLPEDPDRLMVVTGQYRSLTCSASGRALLSARTNAEIALWVRRSNAEATEARFRVKEVAFLSLMRQVRAEGFAASAGDVTPGLGAYAMTFNAPMGDVKMAVAVGGPLLRVQKRRDSIVEALHKFRSAFH